MTTLESKIIGILYSLRDDVDWENENELIDRGLIDSFDMITLIGELGNAFSVKIGLEDLDPENFNSVSAIALLLERLGADI